MSTFEITFAVTPAGTDEDGRPDTAYVLVCRTCSQGQAEPVVLPFGTAKARGKWAAKHRDATGHDSWWVVDHPMSSPHPGGND